MLNLFVLAIAVGIGALGFIILNPRYLYKSTVKNVTPLMQKRYAKHPDGQVSTIDYDYVNHNGKHMWMFNEWDEEIHAEVPGDIIIQSGAEYGNAFFIFRFNRDGTEQEWDEPLYRDYFLWMKEKVKHRQQRFLHKLSLEDFDKFASSVRGERDSRKLDKKYVAALVAKREGVPSQPEVGVEEKKKEEKK